MGWEGFVSIFLFFVSIILTAGEKCDRGTGTLSHFSAEYIGCSPHIEKCDSCTRPPVTLFARLLSSHI